MSDPNQDLSEEQAFELARQSLRAAMLGGRPARAAADIVWPIAFEAGRRAAARDLAVDVDDEAERPGPRSVVEEQQPRTLGEAGG